MLTHPTVTINQNPFKNMGLHPSGKRARRHSFAENIVKIKQNSDNLF